MVKPLLTDVFGGGVSQTETTITIAKADLPGLTPSANNSAESLLIGILLKAKVSLTQTNFDSNIDQSTYVSAGYSSFTTRGVDNAPYRVDQMTVNLSKPDTGATIDPDNY